MAREPMGYTVGHVEGTWASRSPPDRSRGLRPFSEWRWPRSTTGPINGRCPPRRSAGGCCSPGGPSAPGSDRRRPILTERAARFS